MLVGRERETESCSDCLELSFFFFFFFRRCNASNLDFNGEARVYVIALQPTVSPNSPVPFRRWLFVRLVPCNMNFEFSPCSTSTFMISELVSWKCYGRSKR